MLRFVLFAAGVLSLPALALNFNSWQCKKGGGGSGGGWSNELRLDKVAGSEVYAAKYVARSWGPHGHGGTSTAKEGTLRIVASPQRGQFVWRAERVSGDIPAAIETSLSKSMTSGYVSYRVAIAGSPGIKFEASVNLSPYLGTCEIDGRRPNTDDVGAAYDDEPFPTRPFKHLECRSAAQSLDLSCEGECRRGSSFTAELTAPGATAVQSKGVLQFQGTLPFALQANEPTWFYVEGLKRERLTLQGASRVENTLTATLGQTTVVFDYEADCRVQ